MEFSTGASITWTHPVLDGTPCDEQPKKNPFQKKIIQNCKFHSKSVKKKSP